VQNKIDIVQCAVGVVLFGGAVFAISGAWTKGKAFFADRRRDKTASNELKEALKPTETDQQLAALNSKVAGMAISSSEAPNRTPETDGRVTPATSRDRSPK
jgi:hypothetical protein